MELIQCSESKFILHMTPEDMTKYNFKNSRADAMAQNIRIMLNDTGASDYFPSQSRITVKIFESKEGGCQLFITRLGDQLTATDLKQCYIYRFPDIEMLLPACKAINNSMRHTDGKVYYEKEKPFVYLVLDRDFPNMPEFGGSECKKSSLMYIEEHCVPLQNSTIESLGNLT